jgi:hypothetical protein
MLRSLSRFKKEMHKKDFELIYINGIMNLMLKIMIWIRPERYPLRTNKKLHVRSAGPFKVP